MHQSGEGVCARNPTPTYRAPRLQPLQHLPSVRTMASTTEEDPSPPSTRNSQPTAPPAIPHRTPNPAAPPPPRSRTATTSSNSRTRADHRLQVPKNESRNTRPPSNAPSAPNASRAPTTSGRTCARTPTNGPSSAPSAARPLHGSTIVNDTRAYTAARRNSSAEANSARAGTGVVGDVSRALTPWGDISGARLDGSVLNRCWTKRLWSVNASSMSR